jgi:CubicO group peptidase (beta-lactamase class C family)
MRPLGIRTVGAAAITAMLVVGCSASGDSGRAGKGSGDGAIAAAISGRLKPVLDAGGAWSSVRAILVTVDGKPVIEKYYHSTTDKYHNVFSITKSVLSTLIGIAVGEGRIAGVNANLAHLLPHYAKGMSPQVARTTLKQVLTMTAGFTGEADPHAFTFMSADDPTQAVLNSADGTPGKFAYSDAGAHLVSAILRTATGQSVLEFARSKLFDPLGIASKPATEPIANQDSLQPLTVADFVWPVDIQGLHLGWSGLNLRPSDMAKLGNLYLNGGLWKGSRIVPADWVRDATTSHVHTPGLAPPDSSYGYEWWSGKAHGEPEFGAVGFGGQRILVAPALHTVIVVATEADFSDPAGEGISPEQSAQIADEIISALKNP